MTGPEVGPGHGGDNLPPKKSPAQHAGSVVEQHPTGLGAAVATLIVVVTSQFFDVEWDADLAAAFVGAVSVIVSAFSPRQTGAQ